MTLSLIIVVILAAFILEFFDASAGMGYGSLTPILLLMGFPPLEAISAVILTSAVLSLFAGYLHHDFDNIDFLLKKNIKILSILISFGIMAIIIGAAMAISIPEDILKTYIGLLIIVIGISIITYHKKHDFSWKRLIFFGSLASFNKGISGEGFGPVLAGGQIASGVDSRHAVSITALTEGVVSSIGFLVYLLINGAGHMNWSLILYLLIGGAVSTPLAVCFVKKFHPKKLKSLIGTLSIILGLAILTKLFF
ncbi:sulfite exporter TauE/SafE family protein [Candidatus Peregrinibacteria bacterium]|nr:sulfite exporter TauE/SafE family protein [Candidatus Peregrinibacteria bacterium]